LNDNNVHNADNEYYSGEQDVSSERSVSWILIFVGVIFVVSCEIACSDSAIRGYITSNITLSHLISKDADVV